MPVLTERIERRRPRKPRPYELTDAERVNVKRAMKHARARFGSWRKLSAAVGITGKRLQMASLPAGKPSVVVALGVARAAGVPLEAMLSGTWPVGACPLCGHVAEQP